ncbi:MAG: chemotaxis protein CheC [Methanolobus sp.]|jgi:chemotaxis protein CheC|uniref:Chemotaxis protein CheC, inhibitor of MCP methylation n=1 Tax=Methanolobus tindarius DSM 2278 TaxID=1090322 RepID=W9DMZ8_METTI|nr:MULTISPECIES: chemotaxis protein CheC [Methanolobus]ETA67234.1 chemotaxis protein CheC, inhibitor of MCP methylation [Methanolobus tindarius DSM 2278]MDK2832368.1 chemotaxis protein CheC [Methanolobus sp.]MDK2939194.1 chemotaxis protein CheC [Methanolobus sp.]
MNIVLDKFYYDALNEVGNIGMGNATTALSQLVGKSINVSGSSLTLLKAKDISESLNSEKIGAIVRVMGDMNGGFILILSKNHSEVLADMLLKDSAEDSYMKVSAFIEVANILAGSYYNALSKFLNLSIIPSIPTISEGTTDEIFEKAKKHMSGKIDHIFGLTTLFEITGEDEYHSLSGDMYMLLDTASLQSVIDRIEEMRTR